MRARHGKRPQQERALGVGPAAAPGSAKANEHARVRGALIQYRRFFVRGVSRRTGTTCLKDAFGEPFVLSELSSCRGEHFLVFGRGCSRTCRDGVGCAFCNNY